MVSISLAAKMGLNKKASGASHVDECNVLYPVYIIVANTEDYVCVYSFVPNERVDIQV